MEQNKQYIVMEDLTIFKKGAIVQVLNNNGLLICYEPASGNSYVLHKQFTPEEFNEVFMPDTPAARVLYGAKV